MPVNYTETLVSSMTSAKEEQTQLITKRREKYF